MATESPRSSPDLAGRVVCKLEFECRRLIGEDVFLFYHPVHVEDFTLSVWARLRKRRTKKKYNKKKREIDLFLRSLEPKRYSDDDEENLESDPDLDWEHKQLQAKKLLRLLRTDEEESGYECGFSLNLYEDGKVIRLSDDPRFRGLSWLEHIPSCSLRWDMLAPAVRDVIRIAGVNPKLSSPPNSTQ